jgi:hypothetical protein
MKPFFTFIFLSLFLANSSAQRLSIPANIKMPSDSPLIQRLVNSLQGLVSDTLGFSHSQYVDLQHLQKNSYFFDEIKAANILLNRKNTGNKCQILNIILQRKGLYKISLAFTNSTSGQLERIYTLLARDRQGYFVFECPLDYNVQDWTVKTIGDIRFHYQGTFNQEQAEQFDRLNQRIAKTLEVQRLEIDYYKSNTIQETYRVVGIDYDVSSNGESINSISDTSTNTLFGGIDWFGYGHGLVHLYCKKYLTKQGIKNRQVEEGFAYFLGGCWEVKLQDLKKDLKNYLSDNPMSSPLQVFGLKTYLDPTKFHYTFAPIDDGVRGKHIMLGMFCEELDKSNKSFELLMCGKTEDQLWLKLNVLLGINKDNFDVKLRELLSR